MGSLCKQKIFGKNGLVCGFINTTETAARLFLVKAILFLFFGLTGKSQFSNCQPVYNSFVLK